MARTTQPDPPSPTPASLGLSSPSVVLPWALVCPFPEMLSAEASAWLTSPPSLSLNTSSSGKPSLAS